MRVCATLDKPLHAPGALLTKRPFMGHPAGAGTYPVRVLSMIDGICRDDGHPLDILETRTLR